MYRSYDLIRRFVKSNEFHFYYINYKIVLNKFQYDKLKDDTPSNVSKLCFKAGCPVRTDLLSSLGFNQKGFSNNYQIF